MFDERIERPALSGGQGGSDHLHTWGKPRTQGLLTLTFGVSVDVVVEVTPPAGGTFTVTPPVVSVPDGAFTLTLPPVAGAAAGCVWVVVVTVCSVVGCTAGWVCVVVTVCS